MEGISKFRTNLPEHVVCVPQLSPEELAEQHITPVTVSLSIRTEHIDEIIDNLAQALDKI